MSKGLEHLPYEAGQKHLNLEKEIQGGKQQQQLRGDTIEVSRMEKADFP